VFPFFQLAGLSSPFSSGEGGFKGLDFDFDFSKLFGDGNIMKGASSDLPAIPGKDSLPSVDFEGLLKSSDILKGFTSDVPNVPEVEKLSVPFLD